MHSMPGACGQVVMHEEIYRVAASSPYSCIPCTHRESRDLVRVKLKFWKHFARTSPGIGSEGRHGFSSSQLSYGAHRILPGASAFPCLRYPFNGNRHWYSSPRS